MWTSGNSTLFQKSGLLGVYSKSREGRDKLGSLCLLLHLLVCYVLLSVALQPARELDFCCCLRLRACVFRCVREGGKQGYWGASERKQFVCVYACEQTSLHVCVPLGTMGLLLAAPYQFITKPPGTGTFCRKTGARCSAALCAAAFKVGGCW